MKITLRYLIILLFISSLFSFSCNEKVPPEINAPKVKITGTSVDEGDVNSEASVEVQMDKAWAQDLLIEYVVSDQSAVEKEDYIASGGTLKIPAGDITGSISITIVGDTIKEPDETVEIAIRDAGVASVVGSKATITIRNDDDFVFIPQDGYSTPTSYAGYKKVWSDEFNGSSLSNDWFFEIGASGLGNNELQYYTDGANAEVTGGNLVIEAREESFDGAPYTSARIITRGKQEFKYGRVDIRAVLPEGQGIWPALWMLGSNIGSIGWPQCGEIDIMEMIGHQPSTVHGTLHWQNASGDHASAGNEISLSGSKFKDEFHVFSMIWDKNSIRFYMDDIKYHEVNITPQDMSEFHAPYFFIFNIAVGGNWPGYPDNTTTFPQRMLVDYVRVFQEV